jgi:cold shock CspA family protein
MSGQPSHTRFGTVAEFDEPVGLGILREPDGTRHPFHCTAITDGSRDIQIGAEVSFSLVAARAGRYEATDIVAR